MINNYSRVVNWDQELILVTITVLMKSLANRTKLYIVCMVNRGGWLISPDLPYVAMMGEGNY